MDRRSWVSVMIRLAMTAVAVFGGFAAGVGATELFEKSGWPGEEQEAILPGGEVAATLAALAVASTAIAVGRRRQHAIAHDALIVTGTSALAVAMAGGFMEGAVLIASILVAAGMMPVVHFTESRAGLAVVAAIGLTLGTNTFPNAWTPYALSITLLVLLAPVLVWLLSETGRRRAVPMGLAVVLGVTAMALGTQPTGDYIEWPVFMVAPLLLSGLAWVALKAGPIQLPRFA